MAQFCAKSPEDFLQAALQVQDEPVGIRVEVVFFFFPRFVDVFLGGKVG